MRRLSLLALALVLSGCRDGGLLSPRGEAGPPQHDISDAVHNGGTPGFYFLPPMVPNPEVQGAFNPSLYPVIRICALGTDNQCLSGGSTPTSRTYDRFTTPAIQVIDQHYQLDWSTQDVDVAYTYRIEVYARKLNGIPNLLLGYADVKFEVTGTGKRGKNVQTSDTIPLVSGQTLAVKWKIQEGTVLAALQASGECNDCAEKTFYVGQEGGLLVPSKHAALYVGPSSLNNVVDAAGRPVSSVTFLINRINPRSEDGPCFDPSASLGIIEAEGCYEYTTEPFLRDGFAAGYPIQIEICLDPGRSVDDYDLYKDSPLRTPRFTKLAYPSMYPVSQVQACENFQPFPFPSLADVSGLDRLLHLARAGWNAVGGPVARFLGPRAAFAGDRTYTADASNLSPSRIGWGRTLTIAAESGDGQSAVAGTAVPSNPTVRVGGRAGHALSDPGVVTWTTDSGGAIGAVTSVAAVDPTTGASTGELLVSVPWTLGSAAGSQTLTASVPGASPVVFTATATTVSITATVRLDGSPAPGAQVQAVNPTTGLTRSALTNAAGDAVITGLAAGTYTVAASLPGATFSPQQVTLPATQPVALVFTSGLISHWSGSRDAATGQFVDGVGGNHGSAVRAVQEVTSGVLGSALHFPATGGSSAGPSSNTGKVLAGSSGLDNAEYITLSTWVNFDAGASGTYIQRFVTLENERAVIRMDGYYGLTDANGGYAGQDHSLHFYVKSGGLLHHVRTDGKWATGALAERGCWYHVAGTFNGQTLVLYLNGQEVARTSLAGTMDPGATEGVRLSASSADGQGEDWEAMQGMLDEVRIYNRALAATEIASQYSQRGSGITTCSVPTQ